MKGMLPRKRVILELNDVDKVAETTEDITTMAMKIWRNRYEDLGVAPGIEYILIPPPSTRKVSIYLIAHSPKMNSFRAFKRNRI